MVQNLPNEIWVFVAGYEGIYSVSNFSRIKSLEKRVKSWRGHRAIDERLLTPHTDVYGYKVVCLRKNNKSEVLKFHRLLAKAFIPNTDNKPQINHKNGIKTDNRLENLEWCTNSENQIHSYSILGKKSPWDGKKRPKFKDSHRSNISASKNGGKCILNKETGIFYGTVNEAAFSVGMKRRTLSAKLTGQIPNNTNIIYV